MFLCVLGCDRTWNDGDTIGSEKWDKLKSKTEPWEGLDKFGSAYKNILRVRYD